MNWTPILDDDDDDGDLPFNFTLNDSETIEEPCNRKESELNALCVEPAVQFSITDTEYEAPHTSSERTDVLLENQKAFQSNPSLSRTVTNRISDNDSEIIHDRDKPILMGHKYFKFNQSNDNESVNGSDLEEDNLEEDFSTLFDNGDSDVSPLVYNQQQFQAEQAKLNAQFYRGLGNTSSRDDDNEPIGSFAVKLQFKLD